MGWERLAVLDAAWSRGSETNYSYFCRISTEFIPIQQERSSAGVYPGIYKCNTVNPK